MVFFNNIRSSDRLDWTEYSPQEVGSFSLEYSESKNKPYNERIDFECCAVGSNFYRYPKSISLNYTRSGF